MRNGRKQGNNKFKYICEEIREVVIFSNRNIKREETVFKIVYEYHMGKYNRKKMLIKKR